MYKTIPSNALPAKSNLRNRACAPSVQSRPMVSEGRMNARACTQSVSFPHQAVAVAAYGPGLGNKLHTM